MVKVRHGARGDSGGQKKCIGRQRTQRMCGRGGVEGRQGLVGLLEGNLLDGELLDPVLKRRATALRE